MKLLSVEDARARMLDGAGPLGTERIPLAEAVGRTLAEDVTAVRDQPPFPASAMDGWAVRAADLADGPATLRILGESAAGRGFDGVVGPGEAVRIFTGAPVPPGADRIVIQEEATREGDRVRLAPTTASSFVRPRGGDFRAGDALLTGGVRVDPWRLALAASAGRAELAVARRPVVAVVSTGEEIVAAGAAPGPHAIFDSAGPALVARATAAGADARRAPTLGDDLQAIAAALADMPADLIVTVGGASVGDHDLVKPALATLGLKLRVESVRVRPGKPTWFGRLPDGRRVLGLPGNPASALVCAELFLAPLLAALQGADAAPPLRRFRLLEALPAEGPREHWLRARVSSGEDGALEAWAMPDQDSSLVTVLAAAGALIRREAGAAAAAVGASVDGVLLERA